MSFYLDADRRSLIVEETVGGTDSRGSLRLGVGCVAFSTNVRVFLVHSFVSLPIHARSCRTPSNRLSRDSAVHAAPERRQVHLTWQGPPRRAQVLKLPLLPDLVYGPASLVVLCVRPPHLRRRSIKAR